MIFGGMGWATGFSLGTAPPGFLCALRVVAFPNLLALGGHLGPRGVVSVATIPYFSFTTKEKRVRNIGCADRG